MTIKKNKKPIGAKTIYMVVSEDENKFFHGLSEARQYAEDLCEEKEEEIEIFEVTKTWEVYFPEDPHPEIHEGNLDTCLE